MSRASSVSRRNFPQKRVQTDKVGGWWKPFRINLLILRNNAPWLIVTLLAVIFGTVALFEVRTSQFQSRVLSSFASRLSYLVGPGPSPSIAFPSSGPYNEARGYAEMPEFVHR